MRKVGLSAMAMQGRSGPLSVMNGRLESGDPGGASSDAQRRVFKSGPLTSMMPKVYAEVTKAVSYADLPDGLPIRGGRKETRFGGGGGNGGSGVVSIGSAIDTPRFRDSDSQTSSSSGSHHHPPHSNTHTHNHPQPIKSCLKDCSTHAADRSIVVLGMESPQLGAVPLSVSPSLVSSHMVMSEGDGRQREGLGASEDAPEREREWMLDGGGGNGGSQAGEWNDTWSKWKASGIEYHLGTGIGSGTGYGPSSRVPLPRSSGHPHIPRSGVLGRRSVGIPPSGPLEDGRRLSAFSAMGKVGKSGMIGKSGMVGKSGMIGKSGMMPKSGAVGKSGLLLGKSGILIGKSGMVRPDNIEEEEDDSGDSEEESDDDLPDDVGLYLKKKRRKCSGRQLFQWIILVTLCSALGLLLFTPYFQHLEIINLRVWKLSVFAIAVMGGSLISEWIVQIFVAVIGMQYTLKERLLYFVWAIRKPVKNFLWILCILITWLVLFDSADFKHHGNVTMTLACVLVALGMVLVRVLVVKYVAIHFYAQAFFDRIQETVFDQHVLENLSLPMPDIGNWGALNSGDDGIGVPVRDGNDSDSDYEGSGGIAGGQKKGGVSMGRSQLGNGGLDMTGPLEEMPVAPGVGPIDPDRPRPPGDCPDPGNQAGPLPGTGGGLAGLGIEEGGDGTGNNSSACANPSCAGQVGGTVAAAPAAQAAPAAGGGGGGGGGAGHSDGKAGVSMPRRPGGATKEVHTMMGDGAEAAAEGDGLFGQGGEAKNTEDTEPGISSPLFGVTQKTLKENYFCDDIGSEFVALEVTKNAMEKMIRSGSEKSGKGGSLSNQVSFRGMQGSVSQVVRSLQRVGHALSMGRLSSRSYSRMKAEKAGGDYRKNDKGERSMRKRRLLSLTSATVSARAMGKLMKFIQREKISTYSTLVDNSVQKDGEIQTEGEAKAAAYRIFNNVSRAGTNYVEEEDLYWFLEEEDAQKAFRRFDGWENGRVTKRAVKKWVQEVFKKRQALAASINDTSSAISKLDGLLTPIVWGVIVFVWLRVWNITSAPVVVFLMSVIASLIVVFGATARSTLEAVMFLFVVHPYDVGDRCAIDGEELIVQEINIQNTIFLRWDSLKVYYPNALLREKPIFNYYRSPHMWDIIPFDIAVSTSVDKVTHLRECISKYIGRTPEHFHPDFYLMTRAVEEHNKMKMQLWVQHGFNFQEMEKRLQRRSDLIFQLKKDMDELGIHYALLPQEVRFAHGVPMLGHSQYINPFDGSAVGGSIRSSEFRSLDQSRGTPYH